MAGGTSSHTFVVPASAIGGAALLAAGDTLARTLRAPIEMPVGPFMVCSACPSSSGCCGRRSDGGRTRIASPARRCSRRSGVEVEIGGTPILRGADLQLGAGELVAVVGPNGAGKSTLVRAVSGLQTLERRQRAAGAGREVGEMRGRELARPARLRAAADAGAGRGHACAKR